MRYASPVADPEQTVWTIDYAQRSYIVREYRWQSGGDCPLVSTCDIEAANPGHPADVWKSALGDAG